MATLAEQVQQLKGLISDETSARKELQKVVNAVKGDVGEIAAVAEDAKSAMVEFKVTMQQIGAEWTVASSYMGIKDGVPDAAAEGGGTPATHALVKGKGAAAAAKRKSKVPSATASASASVSKKPRTVKTANVGAKANDNGKSGQPDGTVNWSATSKVGKFGRTIYPVEGGGLVAVFQSPVVFPARELKKLVRSTAAARDVSVQSVPRSYTAWTSYIKACEDAVSDLMRKCLDDLKTDVPVYLLEPIQVMVQQKDFNGFIAHQPQPLRSCLEAVLGETNFDHMQDYGKVDKGRLLHEVCLAARAYQNALLGGRLPRSLTAEVPQ